MYIAKLGAHPVTKSLNWSVTVDGYSISNGNKYTTLRRKNNGQVEDTVITDKLCLELCEKAKKDGYNISFQKIGVVTVAPETESAPPSGEPTKISGMKPWTKSDLEALNSDKIVAIAHEMGLSVRGSKKVLVARILDAQAKDE